jgi:hypothetical protein
MNSKPQRKPKQKGQPMNAKKKGHRQHRQFSAQQKCQAVLSLWTEKRKPAEVYKELGITYTLLSQWQDRALTGMLSALEPRVRTEQERGPALGPKLQKLVEKKALETQGKLSKMQQRLETLRPGKTTAK